MPPVDTTARVAKLVEELEALLARLTVAETAVDANTAEIISVKTRVTDLEDIR